MSAMSGRHDSVTEATGYYRHGLRQMLGRDRGEHRAASPLELLYDLAFVAAFGVAGNELAHSIAAGHIGAGLIAYAFAMITIVWAWTNFSWFSSAFDTDDWLFRILTMVQMVGVVILATGIPALFASFDHGDTVIDNTVLIAGYVVIRVALIVQWLRAGATDPRYRPAALLNALFIGLGQIGWVALAVLHVSTATYIGVGIGLFVLEMLGPILAERRGHRTGGATPWHPHHIAERYSLLAIIALGETVFGTLAATQAITDAEGWSVDAVLVVTVGIALALTLWWVYFLVPSAPVLAHKRDKGYIWGYGHIPVYLAIAAVGAGLHLIGYLYDEHFAVSEATVVTTIATAVLVLGISLAVLHGWLIGRIPRNSPIQLASFLFPVAAMIAANLGTPLWICLILILAGPTVVVVSYETGGWNRLTRQLADAIGDVDSDPTSAPSPR